MRVLNLAAAARFLEEVGVLKPVATGAPYVKKVCMGRALLIPATVGENIAQSIKDDKLPRTASSRVVLHREP